ncbi:CalY family protein [Jatrophihabitans cynanchi]|uniref:CalY family protein n=1 Tax=Jatrophihabitans cynanchi TaxID=2944128 RepID=A0ABY7JUM6_9ACTN|nr:SipW-dependent-type signal peptide-containing protein [Jatrophihabitans sp. SB3-54]WAX56043.1 CalY family protein [Jatrophihabitans sp. SB3-54]
MDRRLVSGAIAAIAAVGLGVGGSTSAAFNDFSDVPGNQTAAGTLQLDLTPGASGSVVVSLGRLMPGGRSTRAVWVAANDSTSSIDGTLSLRFHDLVDTAAPCDTSRDKARAVLAAGVAGCTVTDTTVSGVPEHGSLSKVLTMSVSAARMLGAASCSVQSQGTAVALPETGRGNLAMLAASAQQLPVAERDGGRLVLGPGEGVCVAVTADWPGDEAPGTNEPADNAAQGDSLTVQLSFDLTQVHS